MIVPAVAMDNQIDTAILASLAAPFSVIADVFAEVLGSIGLVIMAVGGFSALMASSGCSQELVALCSSKLHVIRSPSLLLVAGYLIGQSLDMVIPSATGLALLLLVSMYPVLRHAGCSKIAAASVISTAGALDIGPASGASNAAANVAGIPVVQYFLENQLLTGLLIVLVVALMHYLIARMEERKQAIESSIDVPTCNSLPKAIVPLLPFVILITAYALDVSLGVVGAIFLCLFIYIGFQLFGDRTLSGSIDSLEVFFKGMGDLFVKVVSLIAAAMTFVEGLKLIGFIDFLIAMAQQSALGAEGFALAAIFVIVVITLISGSGNAAFISLAEPIADFSVQLGENPQAGLVPVQLSSGLFRSCSPFAGVMLAVSSVTGVSVFALIRRNILPMSAGLSVILLSATLF